MKKIILLLILILVVSTSVFANLDIKPLSFDPIYEAYNSSLWSTKLRFQYLMLLNESGPDSVLVSTPYDSSKHYHNETEETKKYDYVYDTMNFRTPGSGQTSYLRLSSGLNVGICKVSYESDNLPTIQAEFSLQGSLNTVFESAGSTDLLGFDGVYFLGLNLGVGDMFTLRAGIHHYSSHYGDEIIESVYEYGDNKDKLLADNDSTIILNYVRQNAIVVGASLKPTSWIRFYSEVNALPKNLLRIRPGIFAPDSTENKEGSNTQVGEVYPSEGNPGGRLTPYGNGYFNMRFNAGVELNYDVPLLGELVFGYDIELIQEGQTKYQVGAYSPNNPWDIEHNISVSQKIGDDLALDVIFHSGRFPLNNLYNFNCKFVSIGFSI